jgi:predicted ester cyclase
MSAEDNEAILRRIVDEVFNQGKLDAIDQFIAPGFVDHNPRQGQGPGLAGFKQGLTQLRTAFPDLRYIVEDVISQGDMVVARATVRGTHRGRLGAIAPTGREFAMTGIVIARFADGRVVERWASFDNLGMLQQLGLIPGIGQSGV